MSSSRRCWPATAAALAQKVQPSAVFVAFVAPFRQLPLAAAARVPLRNTCTGMASTSSLAFTCGSSVDLRVSAYQVPPAVRPPLTRQFCRCSGIVSVSRL